MLIPSDRHRPADLIIWRELEAADHIHGERLMRSGKVDRSLDAIRTFLAAGPAYCGTSHGKESVTTCHLVRQVDPSIPLIHLRPSNHNPDCDAVRDAYFAMFPEQAPVYSEVVIDYGDLHARGLPDHLLDKATDRLWEAAIRQSGHPCGGRHILGIRAGESNGRLMRCRIWGESSPKGCAPLAWWSTDDVYGYLAVMGLPVHPAYAMLGAMAGGNGARWPRERLRVAEIGDTHGKGSGRRAWEADYYGPELRRLEARGRTVA